MSQNSGSARVTTKEIDITGPVTQVPTGVPAGIIGTAVKGPAYVPVTVGNISDWYAKFGKTDGEKFGPLAVSEWLRNSSAVTYLRVLGVGDGKKRQEDGSVNQAGFTVGEEQPRESDGRISHNQYAVSGSGSVLGRTYFLGAFMSESAGSDIFTSAGLTNDNSAVPIIRGILMAPSGVILRLSSSMVPSSAPSSTDVATEASSSGGIIGSVTLMEDGTPKQDFVLLLNGHKGSNAKYPNVITASFDMTSPNYFANVFNKDPLKYQEAGHLLYAHWDIHPKLAVVTGTGIVSESYGAGGVDAVKPGVEASAFLTTSSIARNTGTETIPNYEAWTDRFSHAKTPWVISQKFGGNPVDLFRLHSIDAGSSVSTMYKFSIENLTPSQDPAYPYGTFDLVIRSWDDNDNNVKPLERWPRLSLDPSSDRYIAKVIGDTHVFYDFDKAEGKQRIVVDGNYENKSNLVRVEVSYEVENALIDPSALPFGFRGHPHLVTSGSAPLAVDSGIELNASASNILKNAVQPPVPMRTNITQGSGPKLTVNPFLYWGVRFEHVTSLDTPNASLVRDKSLVSFAKYYPDFATDTQKMLVSDNHGEPDTVENGIIDCDRFNRNMFTLENIKIVTGTAGTADPSMWKYATYVRDGNIVPDDVEKTRAFNITDLTQPNRKYAKFTFFAQGGFDGVNIFDKDEVAINNNAVVADMNDAMRGRNNGPNVKAYHKALEVMKNTTNADIQLLATPGIRHPIVTDAAINAVEERFDALYIMDIEQFDNMRNNVTSDDQLPSVAATVDAFKQRALDSSFAAAYFPDVVMTDPNVGTNVTAPPSVVALGAMALNDAVGHPWFAPAGYARGALQSVLEPRVQLSEENMDMLSDAMINAIVSFPSNTPVPGMKPKGSVVIWGQKTLQAQASALDRINVRRLLINIRRQTREVAQSIIFEPNREATLAAFSKAMEPRLAKIQALSGIERYKIIIDSSTTTQADIENNTIRGKIYVQPTKSIEIVSIDFVASNSATM